MSKIPYTKLRTFEADDVVLSLERGLAFVMFDVAGTRYGFALKRPQLVDLAIQIEQQTGGVLLSARPAKKKKT